MRGWTFRFLILWAGAVPASVYAERLFGSCLRTADNARRLEYSNEWLFIPFINWRCSSLLLQLVPCALQKLLPVTFYFTSSREKYSIENWLEMLAFPATLAINVIANMTNQQQQQLSTIVCCVSFALMAENADWWTRISPKQRWCDICPHCDDILEATFLSTCYFDKSQIYV